MFIVGGCLLLTIAHWNTELSRPYGIAFVGWLIVLMEQVWTGYGQR